MKYTLYILLFFVLHTAFGQDATTKTPNDTIVTGKVVNAQDGKIMDNVHVLNLNKVKGTLTNTEGEFTMNAAVNDTLYFSYLGFKSIKVRVTNDMINFPGTKIELTELAFALEDVVINQYNLTGYLDIDAKNAPVNDNLRYSIAGLDIGYEAGSSGRSAVTRVINSIFNPADFLYNMFGNKGKQMRKLRQMKEDDAIRNMLATKFDRETLTALLQIDESELEEILTYCNYSKGFIETANDLQILDAISGCYEDYKVLNRNK
ncbi:CarboxypepD_reg-like domain-containing protein [Pustulibacterium marinum]|uniref:CarboxypepD_reg-like domain-containing protein n=1 Tax=Pustulibacterium marinum TaxID=1224947 RepID=A0A1I7FT67_9FLAO|nr:carboxypeptidase-like regulatory domain-containing protein [Pustulibacterium marinum]SFU39361.1 CarboxypepD_reg-like domain-containing protein [Pustulibacterium marinum]